MILTGAPTNRIQCRYTNYYVLMKHENDTLNLSKTDNLYIGHQIGFNL